MSPEILRHAKAYPFTIPSRSYVVAAGAHEELGPDAAAPDISGRRQARVPEYAGGHHEKMDGTGYPKKLNKDDMSVPARIMAIADIFEALTAADRPYKLPKKLSDSVKIMSFMKKDAHIDAEIFELFLTSGVYKDYADKFLKPEQIDEVDITEYLKSDD